jgi:hypothetical protein
VSLLVLEKFNCLPALIETHRERTVPRFYVVESTTLFIFHPKTITTMATPPLAKVDPSKEAPVVKVNPSRDEVWSEKFQQVK